MDKQCGTVIWVSDVMVFLSICSSYEAAMQCDKESAEEERWEEG